VTIVVTVPASSGTSNLNVVYQTPTGGALNPYPSTATKSQLIDLVFEELGRAGYDFDRTPNEELSVLRKADALMAQWQAQGCNLNYNFPATFGGGLPTDQIGIPDSAIDTVAMWVAFRVAPGIGKSISAETRKAMAEGKSFLFAQTATIPEMKLPKTTATGIGWKPWNIWFPFETDSWADNVTLSDLTLSNASALAAGNYATTVNTAVSQAQMTIASDASGLFTLQGTLLEAAALPAGTYSLTIRQTFPGATNSPYDTVLTVTAS